MDNQAVSNLNINNIAENEVNSTAPEAFEDRLKKTYEFNRRQRQVDPVLKNLIHYIESEDGKVVSMKVNDMSDESDNLSVYKSFSHGESQYVSFDDSLNDRVSNSNSAVKNLLEHVSIRTHKAKSSIYDSLEDICSLVSNVEKFTPSDENEYLTGIFEHDSLWNQANVAVMSSSAKFDDDSLAIVGIDKSFDDSLEDLNALKNAFEDADICVKSLKSESSCKKNLFKVLYENDESDISNYHRNDANKKSSLSDSLNSKDSLEYSSSHANNKIRINTCLLDEKIDSPKSNIVLSNKSPETNFGLIDNHKINDRPKESQIELVNKLLLNDSNNPNGLWNFACSDANSVNSTASNINGDVDLKPECEITETKESELLKSPSCKLTETKGGRNSRNYQKQSYNIEHHRQPLPSHIKTNISNKFVPQNNFKSSVIKEERKKIVKSITRSPVSHIGELWDKGRCKENYGNNDCAINKQTNLAAPGDDVIEITTIHSKNIIGIKNENFITSLQFDKSCENSKPETHLKYSDSSVGALWQRANDELFFHVSKEKYEYEDVKKDESNERKNKLKKCWVEEVSNQEQAKCDNDEHFVEASDDLHLFIKNTPTKVNVNLCIEVKINDGNSCNKLVINNKNNTVRDKLCNESPSLLLPEDGHWASDKVKSAKKKLKLPLHVNLNQDPNEISSKFNVPLSNDKSCNSEIQFDIPSSQLLQALDLHDSYQCNKISSPQSRNSILPLNLCIRDNLEESVRLSYATNGKENIPIFCINKRKSSDFQTSPKQKTYESKNLKHTDGKQKICKSRSATKIPIRKVENFVVSPVNIKTNEVDFIIKQQKQDMANGTNSKSALTEKIHPDIGAYSPKSHHFCMIRNSISRVPTSVQKTPSKKFKNIQSPVAKYIKQHILPHH